MLTRLLLIGVPLLVFASDIPSDGVIASFTVNQALLSQIQISGKKTQPFMKHGVQQNPNVDLSAKLEFGDGDNASVTKLDFGMSGTTSSHSSQNVGIRGRRRVDVNVTGHVNGNYTQEILVNRDGMQGGTVRGGTNISTDISVSNNRRLLNAKVNEIAHGQASGIVGSYLPGDKRDTDREIRAALAGNFSQMQKSTQEVLSKVNSLSPSLENAPYAVQFSSRSGSKGSMDVTVKDRGKSKERASKPTLTQSDQAATKLVVHEDMLTESLGSQLAGKEIKVRDLPKYLCSEATKKMLNFCNDKIPEESENLSIIFAEENPLKAEMRDGQIKLKLNAVYRLASKRENEPASTLLREPDEKQGDYETLPYQIDVTYELRKGGAKLKALKVHNGGTSLLADAQAGIAQLFGYGKHAEEDASKPKRTLAEKATDAIFHTKLEQSLRGVFKPEMNWPTLKVPTKTALKEAGNKMQAEVKETGDLLPLEAKAEEGWFALSTYLCPPTMPALGITFKVIPWGAGRHALWVDSVVKGSPADLSGVKVGEVIDTFGKDDRKLSSTDYTGFLSEVGSAAKGEATEDRSFHLSGQDLKGKRYTKSIALCPKK